MRMEKVTQRRRKNMSEKKGEISYSDKKTEKVSYCPYRQQNERCNARRQDASVTKHRLAIRK